MIKYLKSLSNENREIGATAVRFHKKITKFDLFLKNIMISIFDRVEI